MDKFSAFKLFYNEFVYKRNILIHYDKIESSIAKIKESVITILSTNEKDIDVYKKTLNTIRSSIRKELEKILEKEPYLFEIYYELYKDNISTNDKISNLPFIITCSFYEDYKVGGNKANRVSRYTSKDKKKIRDEGKSLGLILYFINLLNERNEEQYNKLIQLLTTYYNKSINMNITYSDNQETFNKEKENILKTLKRDMEKARISLDYQYFYDKLEIAFRLKNKTIEEIIENELEDFFTIKYQKALREDQVLLDSSLYHVIDIDTINDYIEEENYKYLEYEKEYKNNKKITFKNSKFSNQLYQELVKFFYNSRLKVNEYEQYNMQQVVSSLIQLDKLSKELPDRLLKYILFKASYSNLLNRDKNERYAIISTIYELYSPYKILDRYEKDRKELNKIIDTLGQTFKNNLEYELLTNGIDIYPLATKNDILEYLKEIEYNFIHNNYRDNLFSKSDLYDTRYYDLFIIDKDLSIKEMISLFESIKKEIKELETNNNDKLYNSLINYISRSILKKKDIKYDKSDKELEQSILKDISLEYLNTSYVDGVIIDKASKNRQKNEFQILFEEYKNTSSFSKLKEKYK